ncbi:hypothetical protein BDW22DRAFT_717726 [Trametopsis cervina]|nr:hypothetical protein BDW22DRAFT_717726 [Trametopsis cervina]
MCSEGQQSSYSLDGSLPIELICWIFSYLGCNELVVCRQLCRKLKQIIDTTAGLQYTIQLYLSGMADNPAHSLSTADKLALLKRYHDQWYSLPAHLERVVLFERIRNGYHTQTRDIQGTVGIGPTPEGHFYFAQLPSRIREIPLKSWVLQLSEHTGFFTFDPQQDLLVILKRASIPEERPCLRLLELSTGRDHPLAACPSIPLPHELDNLDLVPAWRIKGEFFCAEDEEVAFFGIWNWRTGSSTRLYESVASSAWLGSTCLLLATFGDTALSGEGFDPPELILIDLSRGVARLQCWRFRLPIVLAKICRTTFYYTIECEPAVESPAAGLSDPPFCTAEEDSLVVMEASDYPFRLFFVTSTLVKLVKKMSSPPGGSAIVPWSEWGPGNTHVDDEGGNHAWLAVYGTRYMTYRKATSELVVYDFNTRRVQHKMRALDNSEGEQDDPTRIHAYSRTYWRALAEAAKATDEEMAELCLDAAEGESQGGPVFMETSSQHGLMPHGFSKDAIYRLRRHEPKYHAYDAYTL